MKISLCFNGHNAGQGGEEDWVTKNSNVLMSLHMESRKTMMATNL